ncbi:hypothetical protein PaeBR_21565 [Paenibacillus sp. BR2-3]|uniref:hypothetical protein n=1 Tax=Paenibacillus sp. BR2-3 TaxID=3048494 RepID=UPI0039773C7A
MKIRGIRPILMAAAAVLLMSLLQGCGQNKEDGSGGESFAVINDIPGTEVSAGIETAMPQKSATAEAPGVEDNVTDQAAASPVSSELPSSAAPEVTATAEQVDSPTAGSTQVKQEKLPVVHSSMEPKTATAAVPKKAAAAPTAKPTSTPKPVVSAASSAHPDLSGITGIGWSDFFDGEDQTKPSERFWDLHGSKVTIKGFMGEVLSFEKNWFLLIPEPGAECPFDNGDETYWNKIMIVFVPDDVKLRYKSGPLQITGRLDVGIKIDDSGYKTMFRLYDASFKEIE